MSNRLQEGFVVWFTGLSGSGKTTLAAHLEIRLRQCGAQVELLDGDVIRTHLSKGLGFSREDRDENIRRIGFVAELLVRNGIIAIVAAISPYRATRREIRSRVHKFVEIYIDCPMDVLLARDVKRLYRKALAGEIINFTGVSDPYEPPLNAELVIDSSVESPEQSTARVWSTLKSLGMIRFDYPD
jgi:adenylyl-sulfate kinase